MSRGRSSLWTAAAITAAIAVIQAVIVGRGQMSTADRLTGSDWWPTKGTAPRSDYAGAESCAPCHRAQFTSQSATSMARTAIKAEQSDVLRGGRSLKFESGGYSYAINADGRQPTYTVASGTQSASAPLTWAFGDGKVGQSFLFDRNGTFFEARVSYYESAHGLAFTPGRAVTAPRGIDDAMARPVEAGELRRCFACHTTAPTAAGKFDPANAIPGVTCEACHGPGRRHVDAMKQTQRAGGNPPMLNPAKLRPEESVDFCGACHATFWDVMLAHETGITALRSQPYRLRSSRCWTTGDARLTCVACHEPHRPLVTDARAYDDRCLSCHVTSGVPPTPEHPGKACPVGTSACPSCHMPKYEVPDMRHEFTDHQIRITRSRAEAGLPWSGHPPNPSTRPFGLGRVSR
jgi:cytochrome c554/c'-like protein